MGVHRTDLSAHIHQRPSSLRYVGRRTVRRTPLPEPTVKSIALGSASTVASFYLSSISTPCWMTDRVASTQYWPPDWNVSAPAAPVGPAEPPLLDHTDSNGDIRHHAAVESGRRQNRNNYTTPGCDSGLRLQVQPSPRGTGV